MKLNPFSKKSNPYLDKIKSERDALNLELAPLKAELAEAEAEHAAAREKQTRLRDAAGSMSMNTPPAAKAHWPILCEANQRMERLKSKVSNLESQLRPLQQVLATPERFAVAPACKAGLPAASRWPGFPSSARRTSRTYPNNSWSLPTTIRRRCAGPSTGWKTCCSCPMASPAG